MAGFFTSLELSKTAQIKVDVDQMQPNCMECGLYKKCNSPKLNIHGDGIKKILIIGEHTTFEEDEIGVPFSGTEFIEILRSELRFNGINLNRDCWRINSVNCAISEYRMPTKKEINHCRPKIKKAILELNPTLIILMGSMAIESILGKEFSDRSVDRWRAYKIQDEELKCTLFPIYHPSIIVQKNKKKEYKILFSRDIEKAISCLKTPYKEKLEYDKFVTVLRTYKDVKTLLNRIIRNKLKIMFDYEGTGLKPHKPGHKIVSIGIALSVKEAYAFPYNYKSFWTKSELSKIEKLWAKVLKDKKIQKMAHNFSFEDLWSYIIVGVKPARWHWDTMMGEHVLDNRKKSLSLKFLTYIHIGIRPYDKIIKPFLKPAKGEEFNTVEKAPFKELLIYNGLDCIFAWMLYEMQKAKLLKMDRLSEAYRFFFRGQYEMATLTQNGIPTDIDYFKKASKELQIKVDGLQKELLSGREARKFKKKFGRELSITSNPDLGKLFFEVLGKKPIYTDSKKKNYSTAKETLLDLNLPFVDKLLEMKKFEKARGTYLAQFMREYYNGKMHPFFGLYIPVSYRGSVNRPSWQNVPKRDPEVGNLIRKGIVPLPKCRIGEFDFSGAEVITSCSYHRDKNFYNYLIDPSTDMHRDNATDLFILPKNMLVNSNYTKEQAKLAKMLRFFSKNNWTFAQFYGDWFYSCAEQLWKNCVSSGMKLPTGQTIKDHLADNGIYEFGEIIKGRPEQGTFIDHCKDVEDKMWNVRFPEYTRWKKDIVKFYHDYGYIETFFGFRFVGLMDDKQCCNFPIQGTSFHLLVYTLIQVHKFIKKHKLRTTVIGQIHDSLISNIYDEETEFYINGVNKIVTGLKDRFDWLMVPMEMEYELSKLKEEGGNFSSLKEYSLNDINAGKFRV